MYVYDRSNIMTTTTKNRSEKEMISDFKELTTDLKIRGINPGFHIMDKEASTALKKATTTMDIKYQSVPPSNHRAKNADRDIHTFKKHFVAWLCSVDSDFHLQLWDKILQQEKISLNLLQQPRPHTHLSAYTHIYVEFD